MDDITESNEKSCPKCKHPMMEGPLRLGSGSESRVADWWCANCHHAMEAKPPPRSSGLVVNPDPLATTPSTFCPGCGRHIGGLRLHADGCPRVGS